MFRNLFKAFLRTIFGWLYQVRVRGNLKVLESNERTLIIANHESWLDGLLLGLFLPGNPVFVVYTGIVGRPFFRLALSLVDYLKVDTTSPMAMKKVVELLKSGRPVVIFPEGRLTTTGALMKVYDGPAFAALKSEATIIPVGMDGAGRTYFTRLKGTHPRKWFPQITLSVQAPTRVTTQDNLSARERRRQAGESMRLIMQDMLFHSADKKTLYQTFVDAVETYGRDREIMADVKQLESPVKTLKSDFSLRERAMMAVGLGFLVNRMMSDYTYGDLLKMTVGLGRLVSKYTKADENVGVFLPNLAVTLGVTLGASSRGRVPAMLNYKAGVTGILDACTAAALKTVVSSRAFIEKGKLQAEAKALEDAGMRVVYLEDVRAEFGLRDKLAVLWELQFPRSIETNADADKPAVVLFTSGTEGKPKGVVLSHRAITSNIAQVRAVYDFNTDDRALNALPIFHSFGLTGGTLLPLFSGIHLILYATPLHYKVIPELAYDKNSTVLFGTNTFLANYGKHANPYDFFRLRYVVAGAEKLTDAVRNLWFEKFGKRIFEGYGATETAPVLAVNTPKAYRVGTVGQFLPGIEHKLVPVPGIDQGGALYVKGPNVMSGYYRFENPGVLEPTTSEVGDGWYATGDVVKVEDGFVSIVDRVKRFAKIGGEMVSLSVVEKIAERAAQGMHAVTTQVDPNKGEALVLFTTSKDVKRDVLSAAAKELGASELSVPRKIVVVDALPLLGTGKTDYVTLKKMAMAA
ncbi:AMP-binding protein [Burkholderia ubonensis]|uniref:AMP-binding protein n=1 Tax=Burkholderia ubonensis TaxID=101571 RepID=UPI000AC33A61|nr:AMP-binding protein [Burkholderia ubonensis]